MASIDGCINIREATHRTSILNRTRGVMIVISIHNYLVQVGVAVLEGLEVGFVDRWRTLELFALIISLISK